MEHRVWGMEYRKHNGRNDPAIFGASQRWPEQRSEFYSGIELNFSLRFSIGFSLLSNGFSHCIQPMGFQPIVFEFLILPYYEKTPQSYCGVFQRTWNFLSFRKDGSSLIRGSSIGLDGYFMDIGSTDILTCC
jgi:hypothetical protein